MTKLWPALLRPRCARPFAVSVSELKSRLSEYMAKVRNGRTVLITDRGKLVARLDPLTDDEDPKAHLAALAAAGIVRLPTGELDERFFADRVIKDPDGKVLQALLDLRGRSHAK